jgi:hypothetical protein
MEWSVHVRGVGTNELPGTKDVPSFLEFVEQIIDSNSWSTMHNLLQTQYAINEGFLAFSSLKRLIIFLGENLVHWCNSIITAGTVITDNGDHEAPDPFKENRTKLVDLLQQSGSITGQNKQLSFQCQHILMNCNELISGWPFGKPSQIVFAFGGDFGIRMLQKGAVVTGTKEEWLSHIIRFVKSRSKWELEVAGLKLGSNNNLYHQTNDREVVQVDVEHWCCLSFSHTERKPGGSRGFSQRSEIGFPHCHPVRTANFSLGIAERGLLAFKLAVENKEW